MDNNLNLYNNKQQMSYIKADDNHLINEKCIRWVKKIDECLHVCSNPNGCIVSQDTHIICKINSPYSYNKFNKYFDSK